MPRTLSPIGAGCGTTALRRRLLPGVAALILATGVLTGCSADAADITAPAAHQVARTARTVSVSASRSALSEDSQSASTSKPGRSGFLLSTGRQ